MPADRRIAASLLALAAGCWLLFIVVWIGGHPTTRANLQTVDGQGEEVPADGVPFDGGEGELATSLRALSSGERLELSFEDGPLLEIILADGTREMLDLPDDAPDGASGIADTILIGTRWLDVGFTGAQERFLYDLADLAAGGAPHIAPVAWLRPDGTFVSAQGPWPDGSYLIETSEVDDPGGLYAAWFDRDGGELFDPPAGSPAASAPALIPIAADGTVAIGVGAGRWWRITPDLELTPVASIGPSVDDGWSEASSSVSEDGYSVSWPGEIWSLAPGG